MNEFDREWDQLPIAELHQLDALCDRFEQALVADASTQIEPFVRDLPESQQRLVVRELMRLDIEWRHADGQLVTAEEYAQQFPQWADELRIKATEDIDNARTVSETINEMSTAIGDTKPNLTRRSRPEDLEGEKEAGDSKANWIEQWREETADLSWANLPTDGVLGHYQLRSVIGRGGMGIVVRARDTKLARDVAIKILTPQISYDIKGNERFLRETQAAAAIQHHHVVTTYAVDTINEVSFLVMELIEGPTLEEHLRNHHQLPADEVAMLAWQIAQGLAAAHEQSLTHRDIKPANILLKQVDQHGSGLLVPSAWQVKIADFGLARAASEVRLTGSGLIAGTPQYMSPEQADGQEIDARSDLFSLGSVMYEMCTGRAAFEAESAIAIVRKIVDKPARPLREFNPETPEWLIEIIDKLMAKSPEERFQSAEEVAESLNVRGELHFARSTPAAQSPVAAAQRKSRVHQLVGVCAIAILGVAATVAFWRSNLSGEDRHPTEHQVGNRGQETKNDTLITVVGNTLHVIGGNGGDSDDAPTDDALTNNALTNNALTNNALTVSFSGGVYTITDDSGQKKLDASSITGSAGSGTNSVTIPQRAIDEIKIVTLAGNDSVTVNSLDDGVNITIDGGDGIDVIHWNNTSQIGDVDLTADAVLVNTGIHSSGGNVNLTANTRIKINLADAGIHLATANSAITTSGSGNVSLTTSRNIITASGSSITTVDGDITLNANRQATQSAGTYSGVRLTDSRLQATGAGNIIVNGRGGVGNGSILGEDGVIILRSKLQANSGSITLEGVGGTNKGDQNNGVQVHDSSVESTGGGSIHITGAAGSTGFGVRILYSGVVRTIGTGAITLTGIGGNSVGPYNIGVAIDYGIKGNGAAVANSGAGTITINATAGGNAPAFFMGRGGTNRLGFDGTNAYSGDIVIQADSFDIADAIIQTTGTTTLQPKSSTALIEVGDADAARKLGLTDEELAQISAGTLIIGRTSPPSSCPP